jgi:hypothetical protein
VGYMVQAGGEVERLAWNRHEDRFALSKCQGDRQGDRGQDCLLTVSPCNACYRRGSGSRLAGHCFFHVFLCLCFLSVHIYSLTLQ